MTAPIRTGAHRPPDLLPRSVFHWTGQDISDAGLLACFLGVIRQTDAGEALIEVSIELQIRPPRMVDAWRFFHAASLFAAARSSHEARARQMGCRIALAVTGWIVTDCVLVEAGASSGFGLFVRGQDRPCVLNVDAEGRTGFERDYRHDADATGTPAAAPMAVQLEEQHALDFPRPMGAK